MENKYSDMSSKGQTTIPLWVRKKLRLNPGDKLGYVEKNDGIVIKKMEPLDMEYLKALDQMVWPEWSSDGDSAYDNL
jgi:AbrB family looped-hinge helix DNA binding protein